MHLHCKYCCTYLISSLLKIWILLMLMVLVKESERNFAKIWQDCNIFISHLPTNGTEKLHHKLCPLWWIGMMTNDQIYVSQWVLPIAHEMKESLCLWPGLLWRNTCGSMLTWKEWTTKIFSKRQTGRQKVVFGVLSLLDFLLCNKKSHNLFKSGQSFLFVGLSQNSKLCGRLVKCQKPMPCDCTTHW